jgi:hypothetical protein
VRLESGRHLAARSLRRRCYFGGVVGDAGSLLLEESGGVVVVLELEFASSQSCPWPAPAPVVSRVQSSALLSVELSVDELELDVSPEVFAPVSARRIVPVVVLLL